MSHSREDIRNLFQSQGLSGGYREFGERPAPPRREQPAAPKDPVATGASPAPAGTKRRAPQLDLVRDAQRSPAAEAATPGSPLASLFEHLAAAGKAGTGDQGKEEQTPEQLMQLPLQALFARLVEQGSRR